MFSINNFRLGAITPVDYRLGSVPIQRMYLGQICVFDRTPAEKTVYKLEIVTGTSNITAEAIGGTFSVEIHSYKETYIGDEPQGDAIRIGFVDSWLVQFPDWCTPRIQDPASNKIYFIDFEFSENTTSQARSATVKFIQVESKKELVFNLYQEAGAITTQYTLNVQPTEDILTGADDDNSTTFTVNTYKQQVINGTVQSAKTHVTCSFDSHNANESAVVLNSTNNNNGTYTGTVTCNMSSTNKDYPITITQSESNKTTTFTLHKIDPTIAYGDITITSFTYPVASAAGETLTPTVTYSQTYGYNGATTGGGTITSGATVTYSGTFVDASTGKIIIPNKGTTVSGETTVSEVTVHVSMNGKTASETFTVKQEANVVTYGEVTGGTATANDILASGGTVQATVTKDATQTVSYTSGSTQSGNITTSATEVSASSLGTTAKNRTQVGTSVLTFTGEGGKTQKVNVTVYQQANVITGTTYKDAQILLEADPMTIPATGGTSELTTYATRTRVDTYTSKATKETSESSAPYTTISGTGFSLSGSSAMNLTITATRNDGAQRTATITSKAYDVTETLTITQSSGQTITSYGDITITGGAATDIPASGGTVKAGGCTATIQVTYSSGSTGSVTVPTENITYTEVSAASLGTTAKERTKVGTSTCNVNYQSKSASKQIDVYQQANSRNETPRLDWGNNSNWKADASGRITEGTSSDDKHAAHTYLQLTYAYTSGSTQIVRIENITLKTDADWINPTASSDFSVDSRGTTIGEERVGNVWFEYEGRSSTKKTVTQAANTATYAVPVVNCTYSDIPASGGSVNPTSSFTQSVSYTSGSSSSVSTGGTWSYVNATNTSTGQVTASSKGKTESGRTEVKTVTANITINGRTGSKQVVVYQQANTKTAGDIKYGAWQVSASANPTTIAASGGTSTITRSASRTRVQNYSYTSGATSQSSLSNETGTPTLSIAGSGFSLNSTTVTASSNVPAKTYTLSVTNPSAELEDGPAHNLSSTVTSTYSIAGTNSRNCTVTANMNGIVKTCTITQSGNTASSGNQDWSVAKGTGLNSATKSSSTVVMTPEPQYGNKNETFTGQCTVTQTGSNKTATATGTWYKGYLNVSPASLQFDANGGTKTVEIDTNLYWEIVPA